MKLISENSVFKNLPLELNMEHRLILDAIRLTFEMIEDDYEVLFEMILQFSNTTIQKGRVAKIFNNAWGIIDNTARLIRLFKQLPSESDHKIFDNFKNLNDFRNTMQHLDERIYESMIKNKMPIYGILKWNFIDLESDSLIPKVLISGLYYGIDTQFMIKDKKDCKNIIDDITLQTVNKKESIELNLTGLMVDLKNVCCINEKHLENIFEKQGWVLCDWSKRQDILISFKSE